MQYGVDGIGVMRGADINFEQPPEAPCEVCGGMVNLESPIDVTVEQANGSMEVERMTEANARALMAMMGIQPPPVMCDEHEEA